MFQFLVKKILYKMCKTIMKNKKCHRVVKYYFKIKSGEYVHTFTTSLKNKSSQFHYIPLEWSPPY